MVTKKKSSTARKRTEQLKSPEKAIGKVACYPLTEPAQLKIGDPLPPGSITLPILKTTLSVFVDQSAIDNATFSFKETVDKGLAAELELSLAGEKGEINAPTHVFAPKSWWAMFKRDVLGIELGENDQIMMHGHIRVGYDVVYPHLKLPKLLPNTQGIVVVAKSVTLT